MLKLAFFCCLASANAFAAPQPPALCALVPVSSPVVITKDGTVVQNLNITLPDGDDFTAALTITAKNVVVRNVYIQHPSNGRGIYFYQADNLTIEKVEIQAYGTDSGPNPCPASPMPPDCDNILGKNSTNASISQVRLEGGSSGIELIYSPYAVISHADIRNVRGPFPRGQCVQFSESDFGVFENFSCINGEDTSWTEDSISAWRSSNVTIKNGLVDGNNSPTGVCVMFEGSSPATHGGLIQNIDTTNCGGGCFSGYPAQDLVMTGVTCANTHCTSFGGRPAPEGCNGWAAGNEDGVTTHGIMVENASVYNLDEKDNIFWMQTSGGFVGDKVTAKVLTSYTPRSPEVIDLCWDEPDAGVRLRPMVEDAAVPEMVEGAA